MVLPYIDMNLPWVYMCSPSWTPPPASLPVPSLWVIPVHQPQASCILHWTWTFYVWFIFHKFQTYFIYFFLHFIYLFILLYIIVLVLPYINMNLPWVYTCSPSWTPLPHPSLYHPSGSYQCTSPEYPVSCIKRGLVIHFTYDIIHVSMPFSQIIPPSPSPTESKRLFYTSVSLLLSCIQGYCYHLSKSHIYVLVYCIGVFLSGLLHSV